MWGPQTIAKLVYNSNNYSLLMFIILILITIVNGVYKPTYIWGGTTSYDPWEGTDDNPNSWMLNGRILGICLEIGP